MFEFLNIKLNAVKELFVEGYIRLKDYLDELLFGDYIDTDDDNDYLNSQNHSEDTTDENNF